MKLWMICCNTEAVYNVYQLTIAGIHVNIETPSDFSGRFSPYLRKVPAGADISVRVSDGEVCEKFERQSEVSARAVESYLIYEKLCDELPRFDAFMLHAATLEYGGGAYAFCAKSGTGKSTHAELWKALLGDKCRYINGDKPVIRTVNGIPAAFGTPWNGKEGRGVAISAPLAGICFLERSKTPSIRAVEPKEGLFRLLSASHRPKNRALDGDFCRCVGNIAENVPMYELSCDISSDAARLSFETMTGRSES